LVQPSLKSVEGPEPASEADLAAPVLRWNPIDLRLPVEDGMCDETAVEIEDPDASHPIQTSGPDDPPVGAAGSQRRAGSIVGLVAPDGTGMKRDAGSPEPHTSDSLTIFIHRCEPKGGVQEDHRKMSKSGIVSSPPYSFYQDDRMSQTLLGMIIPCLVSGFPLAET
jgi:hypothetical protein